MKKLLVWLSVLLLAGSVAWAGDKHDRGYMGVTLTIVNNIGEDEHENGIWVNQVMPGSGAEAAGIEAHDRIVRIDGREVVTVHELHEAMEDAQPDETITVTVLRDGRSQDVTLTLGRHPVSEDVRFGVVVDEHRPYFGVQIEALGSGLADYFGVEGGLLIKEVVPDGPAHAAGIEAGDVVVEIENQPIAAHHDLNKAMEGVSPGDEVEVRISRRGTPMTLYVEAGSRDEHTLTMDVLKLHSEGNNIEIIVPKEEGVTEIRSNKIIIREVKETDED